MGYVVCTLNVRQRLTWHLQVTECSKAGNTEEIGHLTLRCTLQGVPVRYQDHGVHSAKAERCALHCTMAGSAPELWHEWDLAAHKESAVPHQLHEVQLLCQA